MHEPGAVIASGRDADILDAGPGLVVRRARSGRPMHGEAAVMQLVHDAGYPVPRIEAVSEDGTELTMTRVDGPTLLDDVIRHPWRLHAAADLLAGLHRDLHDITVDAPALVADDTLRPAPTGAGPCIVHLDLHPLNVLVSSGGPVVIDWANAAAGEAAADVAVTWVLLDASAAPGGRMVSTIVRALRRRYLERLLASFDRAEVAAALGDAVAWKLQDPNFTPAEHEAMRRLPDRWTAMEPTRRRRP